MPGEEYTEETRVCACLVLVLGAGKIGSLVACLLSQQGSYDVHLGDVTLDAPKHLVEDLGLSASHRPCSTCRNGKQSPLI